MKHPKLLASLFLTLTLGILHSQAAVKEGDTFIGWEDSDGAFVWKYNYSSDAGKPYFHPLRVPGGPELTELTPEDHPWHYALWFSWKYINGVNYWEEDDGQATGETRWSKPSIEKTGAGEVIIRSQIEYVHPSGRVDLTEYRDLVISPVQRNGKYTIDWTSHFTAGPEGALLDRTPLPDEPDGKLWGGYAGLSIRLANGGSPVSFVSTNGPLQAFENDRSRPRVPGIGVTVFPEQPHSGSIALLADPRNMGRDHPWYLINSDTSRFACAAVLIPEPKQLEAGQVWEISYRLVLRPKSWNSEDLEAERSRWLR